MGGSDHVKRGLIANIPKFFAELHCDSEGEESSAAWSSDGEGEGAGIDGGDGHDETEGVDDGFGDDH